MNMQFIARLTFAILLISGVLISWSNYVAREQAKAFAECSAAGSLNTCHTILE